MIPHCVRIRSSHLSCKNTENKRWTSVWGKQYNYQHRKREQLIFPASVGHQSHVHRKAIMSNSSSESKGFCFLYIRVLGWKWKYKTKTKSKQEAAFNHSKVGPHLQFCKAIFSTSFQFHITAYGDLWEVATLMKNKKMGRQVAWRFISCLFIYLFICGCQWDADRTILRQYHSVTALSFKRGNSS